MIICIKENKAKSFIEKWGCVDMANGDEFLPFIYNNIEYYEDILGNKFLKVDYDFTQCLPEGQWKNYMDIVSSYINIADKTVKHHPNAQKTWCDIFAIEHFSDGLARVRTRAGVGVIHEDSSYFLAPKYDSISSCSYGIARSGGICVTKNGNIEYLLLDTSLNEPVWTFAQLPSNIQKIEYAYVGYIYGGETPLGYREGLLACNCKDILIYNVDFCHMDVLNEEYVKIEDPSGKIGLITLSSNCNNMTMAEYACFFPNNASLWFDELFNDIKSTLSKPILPAAYDAIHNYDDEFLIIEKDGKKGYYDCKNHKLKEPFVDSSYSICPRFCSEEFVCKKTSQRGKFRAVYTFENTKNGTVLNLQPEEIPTSPFENGILNTLLTKRGYSRGEVYRISYNSSGEQLSKELAYSYRASRDIDTDTYSDINDALDGDPEAYWNID